MKRNKDDKSSGQEEPAGEKPAGSLAEKVLFLFENCRNPANGKKYTYNEVETLTGGKIRNSWLSKIARGVVTRTNLDALTQLSDFFGVDASFWFRPLDEGIKTKIKVEKGSEAFQRLALRASQLPEEDQVFLSEIVESLLRRQEELKNKNRKKGGT